LYIRKEEDVAQKMKDTKKEKKRDELYIRKEEDVTQKT
jgi:hypothetical protein